MITVAIKYTHGDTWRHIQVALHELPRFKMLMNQLGAKLRFPEAA